MVIKWRRAGDQIMEHAVDICEIRSTYRILAGKPEGNSYKMVN